MNATDEFDELERERQEMWQKFVKGSTIGTAVVALILIALAIFLL